MNSKSLFLKIGYNTLVQIGGKIISVALGFLTVALLTRYLGVEGYGNFTLVFAYLTFFGIIADFGLQLTIVRELSQNTLKAGRIYGTYFWLKFSLVVFSTVLALIALLFFPYSLSLKIGIMIGALAVGIGGLTGCGTAIFQANLRLDLITLVDVIAKIVTVSFIVIFVFLKFSFYYIISTVLIGNLIGFFVTWVIVKKMIKFNFTYDPALAKKIMRWSIPIGFASFFSVAYFRLDMIMLSIMRGSADVGIYSLAYKILENILVLWGFYMASVYPTLSGLSNNRKNFLGFFKKSIFVAFGFSISLIIVGFITAPILINAFGGVGFYASILPFKILLFSVPIFFINNLVYYLFLIEKKMTIVLYGMILALITNFIFNFVFIPRSGYIAASYVTILSEFVLMMFYLIMIPRLKIRL